LSETNKVKKQSENNNYTAISPDSPYDELVTLHSRRKLIPNF
jgi:hypothetical protein